MSRTMRTLPLLVVLLIVGCTDNAAPHGANFASVTGLFVASCGHTEHEFRCWGNLSDLFGQAGSQAPVRLAAPYGSLQSVATSGSEGCGLDVAGRWWWDKPIGAPSRQAARCIAGVRQTTLAWTRPIRLFGTAVPLLCMPTLVCLFHSPWQAMSASRPYRWDTITPVP